MKLSLPANEGLSTGSCFIQTCVSVISLVGVDVGMSPRSGRCPLSTLKLICTSVHPEINTGAIVGYSYVECTIDGMFIP